jgi:tetratricopeptide (TPR) repeat protein
VWRAYLAIYAGDSGQVEKQLKETIEQLLTWSQTNPGSLRWAGILARAYNVLGYFYSRQTQYYKAIVEFAKSIQYWRAIELRSEESAALNNRAFDLAQIGHFHAAIPQAIGGLRLREKIGPRALVGVSVNTLARIELMQFDLAGGLRDAQRAYEIFDRLNSYRGLGLALIALAEAKRRTSVSVTNIQHGRSANLLEEALGHANQAIQIFSQRVEEPSRRVEALREQGRVYRDWCKLRRERPNIISSKESAQGKYSFEQLAQQSRAAFEEAVTLTKNNPHMLIELKLSLAKLYYYAEFYAGIPDYPQKQAEFEASLLAEIETMIPLLYRKPPAQGTPIEREWVLVQSGRLALTRGNLAINRWHYEGQKKEGQKETWLSKALEQYTLCLAFHASYSEHIFLEMRQAQDQIYEQLDKLTLAQKKLLTALVGEIEKQYELGIGHSSMSKFLQERFGTIQEINISLSAS